MIVKPIANADALLRDHLCTIKERTSDIPHAINTQILMI